MDNPNPTTPATPTSTRATSTPQPAAQPIGPAQPATGPSEDALTLLSNFKAIDRAQKGVGLDKIRMFYPKLGWNVILAWVKELEDAGVLTKRAALNARGGIAYQVYTWKEA